MKRTLTLVLITILSLIAVQAMAQPDVAKTAVVPEPSSLLALAAGLTGLATIIRRKLI